MPWWFFPRPSSSRHNSSSSSYRPSYARSSSSSYSRSSSYYKRRPRDGYIERLVSKFKHLLRELWYYLRRNPIKVFFLVVMPLVSGGALAAFAGQFGVKLPGFLSGRGARSVGEGFGGGKGGFGGEGLMEGLGAMGGMGGMGGAGALMGLAKAFL
jgi:hypothetical protein